MFEFTYVGLSICLHVWTFCLRNYRAMIHMCRKYDKYCRSFKQSSHIKS